MKLVKDKHLEWQLKVSLIAKGLEDAGMPRAEAIKAARKELSKARKAKERLNDH